MSIYKFKIRLSEKGELSVEEKNFHPKVDIYKNGRRQLIVLGSPICHGRINDKEISKKLFEKGINEPLIREFDGSFLLLLYDEDQFRLTVANDRFASIPFYYHADKKEFLGSVNYADIWSELCGTRDFAVNKEAFYEFIHLQRLLGDKTYDKKTKYLNSASVLSFNAKENFLKVDKYWRPNFTKKIRSDEEASHILAELVSKSIIKRTSDEKKYGLLLSGGLDSRLVLAGFQRPVECVTIGTDKNNEYFVAEELANAKGYPRSFVRRQDSHYADILDDAVFLGSAMNMHTHAHFLGLDKDLQPKADVFFHGHGFDYMFQGKYLPCELVSIFGKRTYMRRPLNIDKDIKNSFLSKITYRLKPIDPLSLVVDKKKGQIREYINSSLGKVLEEGRDCCNSAEDLWEYLIIHNLSRHYTFLNISSIRTFAEERTVAFDNQLFDFYLSLPTESRLNKKIFVDAIRLLDERLYKIRNANTNFNIYDSDFRLTAKLSINKTLRKFGFEVSLPPEKRDRSWPPYSDIISQSSKIKEMARNLVNSWGLEKLSFLDMNKVKFYVERHLEKKGDHSDLILTLITIDIFIKNSQRSKKSQDETNKCLSCQ